MSTEPSPSYYAIIPANIRYCTELEPGAKLLYGEITALAQKEGYCWATDGYFSSIYGINERTIQRWLKSLKEHKFVVIETTKNESGTERKIWISPEVQKFSRGGQKCRTGTTKMSDGYDKNVGHNITYNNTSKKEEGERAGAHEPSKIFLEHKINYPDVALEPRASTFIHNNKRVKIKLDKLEKLITDFGKEKIDEMIERLDEYADINPKRFKQYACHATVIRKWIRDDVSKMPIKRTEEAKKQEKDDRVERNRDFVFDFRRRRPEIEKEGIDLRLTMGVVEFRRNHSHVAQLSFSEHGFEEQFKNILRKMGIE